MHIRKLLPLVVALCLSGGGLRAQKILVGADFATRFDNREYANNDFNQSQTLFSARLTPRVGVEWQEKNRLVFGVDMLQNFGQHNGAREPFLSDVKPLMYYRFSTENVRAAAGIFDRKELLGDHTETAFSLGNLGVALATAGQWQEAVDTLQEALDCYARAGHTTGPDIEGYRKNLEICRHALKMVAPGTTPQVSDD